MGFLEENEIQMAADVKREANENAQKYMSEPEKTSEPSADPIEGHKLVNVLSVLFILAGVTALIGGGILAKESYHDCAVYFIGGFIAAMFCFGWAAVTRVCALYMKEHDK